MNKKIIVEELTNALIGGEDTENGVAPAPQKTVEPSSNPVVQRDEQNQAQDYIQYVNKPGIIVAIVKGDSYCGIKQIPIGAVDNFRFMKLTDEFALMNQKNLATETEDSLKYESVIDEYEQAKSDVIKQWRDANADTYKVLQKKYGKDLIGADIVENQKRIQHKEEEPEQDDKPQTDKPENGDLVDQNNASQPAK